MTTPAPVIPVIVPAGKDRESRGRRFWILLVLGSLGFAFVLAGGALFALRSWWPAAEVVPGSPALADVTLAPSGEHVSSVKVVDALGRLVPVRVHAGHIVPLGHVAGTARLRVVVTVRRSGWAGWLVGHTEVVQAAIRTPGAYLSSNFVYPAPGDPVSIRFTRPVRVVSVQTVDGASKRITLAHARRVVPIGIASAGSDLAGSALVAGAARTWELLPDPVRVTWFPAGPAPKVLVRPAPSSTLVPSSPIVLTFSRPVRDVLGTTLPRLKPHVRGVWTRPNDHTLVFQPSGLGFPLGRRMHLRLPGSIDLVSGSDPSPFRTVTWQVPRGSLLRMKQLLADQGYLPLRWVPSGGAVRMTQGAQVRAAVDPPEGRFEFRYTKTPAALRALWASASDRPVLMRGAIMAFENAHGLPADGFPSMTVFRALIRNELAGRRSLGGYTYVFVTERLPQTLTLWHNGRVVLRTPVNTGISSRPTDPGTFPVYAHLTATTMAGTNPDGSHYNDPGVPWVNYFNGGDAVHGFVRGSYGWPQSLGCVEVPIPTAAQIFPYVNIGTLVTVSA